MLDAVASKDIEEETVPTHATLPQVPRGDGSMRPADIIEMWEDRGQKKMKVHFHAGQARAWQSERRFVAIIAGAQSGKALALDTPIPTPDGMVPMLDIHEGMTVYGSDGRPCRVIGESPIQIGRDCFKVTFDDGSWVIADADHLWEVQTAKQRKNEARHLKETAHSEWKVNRPQCQRQATTSILTTAKMSRNVMHNAEKRNYSIRTCSPIQHPERDLPIAPYTLGAWLGDGISKGARIVVADPQILEEIARDGYPHGKARECNGGKASVYAIGRDRGRGGNDRTNPLLDLLRSSNLTDNKHIPEVYFKASFEQRLSLVQGMMDTDGYIGKKCEFTSTNFSLADGLRKILLSLGVKVKMSTKIPTIKGKKCRLAYRVTFSTTLPVFRLTRKRDRIKKSIRADATNRYIASIEPVASVPVKCISVDSEDKLYLCTESCIPTHNTVFGPVWLWREMQRRGPGDYLVVTPTYQMLELKALPALIRFFDTQLGLGKYIGSPTRRFVFSPEGEAMLFGKYDEQNPTKILFGYAEDPDSLESMTAKAAWLDEAGQRKFKLGSWLAVNRRLAINEGRALLTTTPYDFGWLKSQIFDRFTAGDTDYDVINFKSTENPAFSQKEYDRAKASMPEWQFDLFYNGVFRKPAGLIYDCFDDKLNLRDRFEIPWQWDRIVGLDFGGVNTAAVFFAEEPFSPRLYLYRSYKAGGRTALEHCFYLQENEPEFRLVVGGSRGEGQWRQEFRAGGRARVKVAGMDVVRVVDGINVRKPKEADVKLGIQRVYGAIKRRELIVFKDMDTVLAEFNDYAWELDANQEPTGEIEDKSAYHFCDSARYVVGTVRGPHYEEDLPVRSETRELLNQKDHAVAVAQRERAAQDYLLEKERRERERRDELDRQDREARLDIMDPRWGFH